MLRIWSTEAENKWLSYICGAEMRTKPLTHVLSSRRAILFVSRFSLDISASYFKAKPLPFIYVLNLKDSQPSSLIVKMLFPYVCPAFHPDFLNLIKIPSGFLKYCYYKSFLRGTLFLSLARQDFLFIRLQCISRSSTLFSYSLFIL